MIIKNYTSIFAVFFALCSFPTFAQNGIQFLDTEWGEVLALAELEGKLIFLDAYTDWCGPCKKMDKDVFSQKKVGDFYNTNFLNVKINMEEGKGVDLAKQYQVVAYPSLLFVNFDGTIAHRFAGYKDENGLLSLGEKALDETNNLAGLEAQYKEGNRTEDFLSKYLRASFEAADGKHTQILEEYLTTQKDWETAEMRELIFNLLDTPNSSLFSYLIKNKAAFYEHFGASMVENKIQGLVYESLRKDETPLANAHQLFKIAYPDKADQLAAKYKMDYYQQRENGQGYAQAAVNYVKSFPNISTEELNDISWIFFDIVEEKKLLRKALKWAKQSVKKNNSYLNNDTLAALYFKLGKNKKALNIAQKAIELAKASGEDYSETEALIATMKK